MKNNRSRRIYLLLAILLILELIIPLIHTEATRVPWVNRSSSTTTSGRHSFDVATEPSIPMNQPRAVGDFTFDPQTGLVTGLTEAGKLNVEAAKTLVLPDAIDGVTVMGIGDGAFRDVLVEAVILPDQPLTIGAYAFAKKIENDYPATSVRIATVTSLKKVTAIGDHAFQGNAITTLDLEAIETIGAYAFSYNALDNAMDLSKATHLHTVGDYAFKDNKIDTLTMPNRADPDVALNLGKGAFANNDLTQIALNGVTGIGDEAFRNNILTAVAISDEVNPFGKDVFSENRQFVAIETTNPLVTTEKSTLGFGHVVNPITVVVHATDEKTGKLIRKITLGDKIVITDPDEVVLLGENTLQAPPVDNYAPVAPVLTFTVEEDLATSEYVVTYNGMVTRFPKDANNTISITVFYNTNKVEPTLTVDPTRLIFEPGAAGETITKTEILKAITATDFEGNPIDPTKIVIQPDTIDKAQSGSTTILITATDPYGNATSKTATVIVADDIKSREFENGWAYDDFMYYKAPGQKGSSLIGLSQKGLEKYKQVQVQGPFGMPIADISLPTLNPYEKEADGSYSLITDIAGYGSDIKTVRLLAKAQPDGFNTRPLSPEVVAAMNDLRFYINGDTELSEETLAAYLAASDQQAMADKAENLIEGFIKTRPFPFSMLSGRTSFGAFKDQLETFSKDAFAPGGFWRYSEFPMGLWDLEKGHLNLSGFNKLRSIGDSALAGYYGYKSVDLSHMPALTSIGDGSVVMISPRRRELTMQHEAARASISFENSAALKTIGDYAFYYPEVAVDINFQGATSLTSIGESAFTAPSDNRTEWYEPEPYPTLLDLSPLVELEYIGKNAFAYTGHPAIQIANLPKLKTISEGAFKSNQKSRVRFDLSGLNALETIGESAFESSQPYYENQSPEEDGIILLAGCANLKTIGRQAFASTDRGQENTTYTKIPIDLTDCIALSAIDATAFIGRIPRPESDRFNGKLVINTTAEVAGHIPSRGNYLINPTEDSLEGNWTVEDFIYADVTPQSPNPIDPTDIVEMNPPTGRYIIGFSPRGQEKVQVNHNVVFPNVDTNGTPIVGIKSESFAGNRHIVQVDLSKMTHLETIGGDSVIVKREKGWDGVFTTAPISLKGTFEDCSNLEQVIFPENIQSIGHDAFALTKVREIDLTNRQGLRVIGHRAFWLKDENYHTMIKLKGADLQVVGAYAFAGNRPYNAPVEDEETVLELPILPQSFRWHYIGIDNYNGAQFRDNNIKQITYHSNEDKVGVFNEWNNNIFGGNNITSYDYHLPNATELKMSGNNTTIRNFTIDAPKLDTLELLKTTYEMPDLDLNKSGLKTLNIQGVRLLADSLKMPSTFTAFNGGESSWSTPRFVTNALYVSDAFTGFHDQMSIEGKDKEPTVIYIQDALGNFVNPHNLVDTDKTLKIDNFTIYRQNYVVNPLTITYEYVTVEDGVEVSLSPQATDTYPRGVGDVNIPANQFFYGYKTPAPVPITLQPGVLNYTVKLVYEKLTEEEISANEKVTMRHNNELINKVPIVSYLIGQQMSTKLYLDVTGTGTVVEGAKVVLYYDPTYVAEDQIYVPTGGVVQSFKAKDGRLEIILRDPIKGGEQLDLNIIWRFKEMVTPQNYTINIKALAVDKTGTVIAKEQPIVPLTGYYNTPVLTKFANGHPYNGRQPGGRRGQGDYVATGKEEDVTYTFTLSELRRKVDGYVLTDTLPLYRKALLDPQGLPQYDAENNLRWTEERAHFDPEKNPGWVLAPDGITLTYTDPAVIGETYVQTRVVGNPLILTYPNALFNVDTVNNASITLAPNNRGEGEPDLTAADDIRVNFWGKGGDWGIYDKNIVGSKVRWEKDAAGREIPGSQFFYDMQEDREQEFVWLLETYNITEMDLGNLVYRDYGLDPRMYYYGVEYDKIHNNKAQVKVYYKDGTSNTYTLSGTPVVGTNRYRHTFYWQHAPNIESFEFIAASDLVMKPGALNRIYMISKLREQDKSHYDYEDVTKNAFINESTLTVSFMVDGVVTSRSTIYDKDSVGIKHRKLMLKGVKPHKVPGYQANDVIANTVKGVNVDYDLALKPILDNDVYDDAFKEILTDVRVVDVLPEGVTLDLSQNGGFTWDQGVAKSGGGDFRVLQNVIVPVYDENGQIKGNRGATVVHFTIPVMKPAEYEQFRLTGYRLGSLHAKVESWVDGSVKNDMWFDMANENISGYNPKPDPTKLLGDGNHGYAEDGLAISGVRMIHSFKEIGLVDPESQDHYQGTGYSTTGVFTETNEPGDNNPKFLYKLNLINATENDVKKNINMIDVFPFIGDEDLTITNARRGTQFENIMAGVPKVYVNGVESADFDVYGVVGRAVQQYTQHSAEPQAAGGLEESPSPRQVFLEGQNWQPIPEGLTPWDYGGYTAIKITQKPGKTFTPNQRIEVIVPMRVWGTPQPGQKAFNSFGLTYDPEGQGTGTLRMIEPNKVFNEIPPPRYKVEASKWEYRGKNSLGNYNTPTTPLPGAKIALFGRTEGKFVKLASAITPFAGPARETLKTYYTVDLGMTGDEAETKLRAVSRNPVKILADLTAYYKAHPVAGKEDYISARDMLKSQPSSVEFELVDFPKYDAFRLVEEEAPQGFEITPISAGEVWHILHRADNYIHFWANAVKNNNVRKTDANGVYYLYTPEDTNAARTVFLDKMKVDIEPLYGEYTFTKVDANDNPLPGASFTMVFNTPREALNAGLQPNDVNYVDEVTYQKLKEPHHATSDAAGRVSFDRLPHGRYILSETQAPMTYMPIPDREIVVSNNKGDTTQLPENRTIKNDKHQLNLFKLAVVDGKENIPLEKLQRLDGVIVDQAPATFDLFEKRGEEWVKKGTYTTSVKDPNDPMSIGGLVKIPDLDLGTLYKIVETLAPEGYPMILDAEGKPKELIFKLSPEGKIQTENGAVFATANLYYPNKMKEGESIIRVRKMNEQGKWGMALQGAQFTLYKQDANGVYQLYDDGDPLTENDAIRYSGEDGYAEYAKLKEGIYKVVESQSPPGYAPTELEYVYNVPKYGNKEFGVLDFTEDGVFTNYPYFIRGLKYLALFKNLDEVAANQKMKEYTDAAKAKDPTEHTEAEALAAADKLKVVKNTAGTYDVAAPLQGVTFTVYEKVNEGLFPRAVPMKREDDTEITVTSDENGNIVFEDAVLKRMSHKNEYFLKELKVEGPFAGKIVINPNLIPVDLTHAKITLEAGVALIDINISNEAHTGKIILSKYEKGDGRNLPGVTYELTGPFGFKERRVTDHAGFITFEHLPFGKYTIREVQALPGYMLEVKVVELTLTQQEPIQKVVFSNMKAVYPQTGGVGSLPYVAIGASLMMLAWWIVNRKKMEVEG